MRLVQALETDSLAEHPHQCACMQTPPVAIGGIGGSGTRVIAGILQELGFYMGGDLNDSLDNLWFTLLFKRRSLWPTEMHQVEISELASLFIHLMSGSHRITESERRRLALCVAEATAEHPLVWREERFESILKSPAKRSHSERWGWKEPNTHIVLPQLLQQLPDLKYIHVIRHGIDMALSSNQNQLKLWGEGLLGREVDVSPRDSLSYWCESHRRLLNAGRSMGDNLLLLNFDRFCESPHTELVALTSFLEERPDPKHLEQLCERVRVPETLGRYRQSDMQQFEPGNLAFVQEMGFVV